MKDVNHCACAVTLKEVRKHPNADKLMITNIFGCNVIVGLNSKEGDKGIYFQSELQLGAVYANKNDLIRRKDPVTGVACGGMFDENRRVRAQKLRGEVSDGFFIGLESLTIAGITSVPKEGEFFDTLDGIAICRKYVPKGSEPGVQKNGNQNAPNKKKSIEKVFKQHFSTTQLRFKMDTLDLEKYAVITEKMEGTSGRSGYHEVAESITNSKFRRWLINLVAPKHMHIGPTSEVSNKEHAIGSRRVVLNTVNRATGWHDPALREMADMPFNQKLHLGETVFYEIVGYEPTGAAIMGTRDNTKLGKDFVKKFGKTTIFNYGLDKGAFEVYVYRITMTSVEGVSVDYPWDAVVERCKELDVKHVPVIWKGIIKTLAHGTHFPWTMPQRDRVSHMIGEYAKGVSMIDPTHIKEGVCLRVEGGLQPNIYKHKNDEYKVLAGINNPVAVVDKDAMEEQ